MVNIFKRMRNLRTVLNFRLGSGAAILPSVANATKEYPAVTRLHLTYARKIYGGHQGARHFWRRCLPRLKYHNPGVPMTVRQTDEQDGPAALTIYFAQRASNAATALAADKKVTDSHAPAPESGEQAAVVNVKDLTYAEIWSRVQAATGAQGVSPTAEETQELKKLEDMRVKSEEDRKRVLGFREAKKDQERMIAEARKEVERLKEM
ncbi:hypothetical protein NUU61_008211 [Penicillium alfredii]|uniref:Ribosomal protein/NADH dehydrogenase domain-containing protein n=1 Tax=Penicillium alfredii TaxID=1506179 RepID=A0A9W9ES91_9EURO|nr:uncharacterized protein NUU61_008211 [Penicillium alfredii]KAJ5086904.1 hypothetical protein NUU61_008211 [Penicillium alfredii]